MRILLLLVVVAFAVACLVGCPPKQDAGTVPTSTPSGCMKRSVGKTGAPTYGKGEKAKMPGAGEEEKAPSDEVAKPDEGREKAKADEGDEPAKGGEATKAEDASKAGDDAADEGKHAEHEGHGH